MTSRRIFAIILVAQLFFGPADTYAADYSKEDAVKAAFIFHFTQFVEWPTDRPKTITIGVFGEDPFNGALDIIHGKMVNGQAIRIKQLSSTERVVDNVQVLIVGWCDEKALTSILASTANRPILTIADRDAFEVEGAIINLFRKGTRQKFGVDRQAASRAGLILSSQLLQIAAAVN